MSLKTTDKQRGRKDEQPIASKNRRDNKGATKKKIRQGQGSISSLPQGTDLSPQHPSRRP